jgi:hypothetical protein
VADLSSTHRFRYWSLSPVFTFLNSYGGTSYDLGGMAKANLGAKIQFWTEPDVAKISKINGIDGWAEHLRTGFDFSPLPQLLARTLVELERNNIYNFDARLALYVSYFYF